MLQCVTGSNYFVVNIIQMLHCVTGSNYFVANKVNNSHVNNLNILRRQHPALAAVWCAPGMRRHQPALAAV